MSELQVRVWPSTNARRWDSLKDRVAPLFRHSPALRGKLAAVKSRDSNNTAMHKVFANGSGHITFTGAISPSGLAMRPIRYLLLDEVDRYPASAGSEGDPVSLAMQRTVNLTPHRPTSGWRVIHAPTETWVVWRGTFRYRPLQLRPGPQPA